MKAKQIYEPRYSKQNNSDYGDSNKQLTSGTNFIQYVVSTQIYRTKNSYHFAYIGLINFLLHAKNSFDYTQFQTSKVKHLLRLSETFSYSCHYSFAVDSGVSIQIYKEQPKAHYTHCHCHCHSV